MGSSKATLSLSFPKSDLNLEEAQEAGDSCDSESDQRVKH